MRRRALILEALISIVRQLERIATVLEHQEKRDGEADEALRSLKDVLGGGDDDG